MRTYQILPNSDPRSPWKIVCDQDGWTLPCRTRESAERRLDALGIYDTADHDSFLAAIGSVFPLETRRQRR